MGELTGLVGFVSVRPLRTMSAASRLGSLFVCAILCLPLAATAQVPEDVQGREILDFIEEGARRQRENARAR